MTIDMILFAVYSLILGGGCFYIGSRGLVGVGSDLKDIKDDIAKIKAHFSAKKPVA